VALLPARALPAAAVLSMAALSASDGAPSPTAPLDLVVNNGPARPIRAVLREGDVLVAVEDLAAAGLRNFLGKRELVEGREHVSLSSLEPLLRYDVDERALALRVTAGVELLGTASLDLRPTRRPAGLEVRGDASGFLNYSVQLRSDQRTAGFAEAGASQGGRLLYASGQLLPDGSAVRGLTSLTFDDVPELRRAVVGDAFAASGGLGGGVLLGGVSIVREYGLDPYFVRSPMPRLTGFTSTPSVLDVYVNGVLTRQVPLAAGGYDVTNLPVTTGAGNVQTVLRDAFGRTEVLNWQYYYTAGLLARGLSDYGYSVGFRRLEYGRTSFEYGRPVFVSRHRFGVADALTLGGRLDMAEDLVSGGPSATLGLPFGSLDLEAAGSAESGTFGAGASAGYSFVSRRFSGGALLRVMTSGYAHAGLRAVDDRARVQSSLFAGAPLGSRVTVGVNYSRSALRDAGPSDVLSARTDYVVAPGLTLGLTGSRTRAPGREPALDVLATLSWSFAPTSIADVSVQAGDSGRTVSAGVQRGLPAGTGFGYRARGGSAPFGDTATGVLQYQWDYGRYEVEYDRLASNGTATSTGLATVAGGAVFVGDRFFLSRPVQDGYGLIRVGVPGVRGFAEGQEIGRTDGKGDLLVPSLLPYYGNRLAIADRDVPIAYRIGPTELLAAPAFRGGVVTRFAVTPLRAVEGELVARTRGEEVPPAFGDVTVQAPGGATFSSPVGGDGRFYLEALPAGTHAAFVDWSGGRCLATLVVPASPSIVDLGKVRCERVIRVNFPGSPEGAGPAWEPDETDAMADAAPDPAAPSREAAAPAASAAPAVPPAAGDAGTAGSTNATTNAAATATSTPTATATSTPPSVAIARGAGAPSPSPPLRPAQLRRAGMGPPSKQCPSCAVCFLAAMDHLAASRYTLSCVRDLAVVEPALSRSEAARACIATLDYRELCRDCRSIRRARVCPPWPDEAARSAVGRRAPAQAKPATSARSASTISSATAVGSVD
jgi:outer membrane usher protein